MKNENTRKKIIDDNFFVIDSNKLEDVISHMYGFSISRNGILTNNYYKQLGEYEEPEPQGVYIMIRKNGNEIILNQDYQGSFGLYIYEDKNDGYFALSNSYLFLLEYLIGKRNISFNKDYANNFIITGLCSYSLNETMIKEIFQAPSNAYIIINIKKKKYKILYNDYKENSIPLESKEGLVIIDKWIDKWGYIFRSLKKITENVYFDLSGGFDTRTLLTILLNSGINMNEVFVHSFQDKLNNHDEDLKIAINISSKFGFKVNGFKYDNKTTKWNLNDTIFCTLYSKLGFHKEFYFQKEFYNKPRFSFKGSGGEALRGAPGIPIEKYKKKISFNNIFGHEKEFFNSSIKLINRSINLLKKEKIFDNDFEISNRLYSKILERNHFGKSALEGYMANIYFIQPLVDPEIRKIKYKNNGKLSHDLIAYIYIRFADALINIPFQGNRHLNKSSIKKAKELNKNNIPYQIKRDYNKHFFIDIERKISVSQISPRKNVNEIFKELFDSSIFFTIINDIYDKNVYNWAKQFFIKSRYFPLRHGYGLLAIAMTVEKMKINEKYMNTTHNIKYEQKIMNYLLQ